MLEPTKLANREGSARPCPANPTSPAPASRENPFPFGRGLTPTAPKRQVRWSGACSELHAHTSGCVPLLEDENIH